MHRIPIGPIGADRMIPVKKQPSNVVNIDTIIITANRQCAKLIKISKTFTLFRAPPYSRAQNKLLGIAKCRNRIHFLDISLLSVQVAAS